MNKTKRGNLVSIAMLLVVYIVLVIAITLMPEKMTYETVRENGPIEILSAYGYLLFCFFIFYFNYIGAIRTTFAPGIFILLLGLRELDFHARFTTMGMFKIRFFMSPEVPVMEKTLVTMFLLAVVSYGVIYLRRILPTFKKHLVCGRPYAVSVICAVFCVVCSKFLDSNSDLLELIFPMGSDPEALSRTMEECMEMLIPVFLIRALLQYSWDSVKGRLQS